MSSDWLANIKSEHWVFVLEAGGSWKKVHLSADYRPHDPLSLGWYTSGSVVHYMAWLDMYTCAVVSFDVRSEKLTIFHGPLGLGYVDMSPSTMMPKADLVEYGGKIAIFQYENLEDNYAVLRVLEDVGRNKWSSKMMFFEPCQMHLVRHNKLVVKGTTQDGKVILAQSEMRYPFYILCYDMKSNDLRKVKIKRVPRLWFDKECVFDLKFMGESESFIYLET